MERGPLGVRAGRSHAGVLLSSAARPLCRVRNTVNNSGMRK
jgi:hypothetical protein